MCIRDSINAEYGGLTNHIMADALAQFLEQEGTLGEIVRAVRQGIYFGVETRIPYAITGVLRPYLFNKKSRPLLDSLKFFADSTLKHGWVMARISCCFKIVERLLMKLTGHSQPLEWQTFVAGCTAGYVFMVRDKADVSLKRQINMAIGIRTLYSFCSCLLYTSDAADEEDSVDLGGRRIIEQKKRTEKIQNMI
eukprot:TRINITY_DN38677_c0_g1_i1.p1 TRINITY_DN38677_c0_g1~~TRINITY_DN38677_c0_g1_i1.p1  ORF type:complete len:194 (+),score=38.08 TRINITY_DN38677_c0_g1_i1:96-677(+)